MIRRDYILRMIEEFFQALARLRSLKQEQRWQQASDAVDEQFRKLLGPDAEHIAELSETELLARLIQGEPTQVVRQKTLLLTTWLKEAGEVATAQNKPEKARGCYLKGLHLLLDILAQGDASEFPEFVPKVDNFITALGDDPLPLPTRARLMQHYERSGEFAKAEDALFGMIDAEPEHPAVVEFGLSFYRRLQAQSDSSLAAGNLPRAELDAGIAELRQRATASAAVK